MPSGKNRKAKGKGAPEKSVGDDENVAEQEEGSPSLIASQNVTEEALAPAQLPEAATATVEPVATPAEPATEPAAELHMTPEKPAAIAVEPAIDAPAAEPAAASPETPGASVLAPSAESPEQAAATTTEPAATLAEPTTESAAELQMTPDKPTAAEPAAASPETPAASVLAAAQRRLQELLPSVKDADVLQELADLPDAAALERLVQRGKPPPKASFRNSVASAGANVCANDNMRKAHDSKQAAMSQSKNLGTVDNKSLAVGGAGAGGGLGLNRPGFGPKVTHFAGRGSVGGAKSINIGEDVPFAWTEMMDDNSPINWVIAAYSSDGKSLELQDKGEGGLTNFKSHLPEGIAWGGLRCYGVDKRGGVECKRPKFIFVQYKPEAASAMKKAKQASHKGDVKEAFAGAHLDVNVETMEDLEEDNLITKLQAATGAHKPNGYEFDTGKFIEADFYGLGVGKSCKSESSKN